MFHVLSDFWTMDHLFCTELTPRRKWTPETFHYISLQIYCQVEGEQTIDTFACKGYVLIYELFGSRNDCVAANSNLWKGILVWIRMHYCLLWLFIKAANECLIQV